ncbi:TIGR03943 family protein [Akkermansiaceae bacterium]|nr:TIGR03943 family protein [bacterium]MDA7537552.1 TIGR03943 family protein [Akkermansiaceae bacterium]MDA7629426.1 TIGR03943 family protein [Akkermansiaceae bacterium]MDA7935195.1 TIGR03943 family protein [Akkermansiaceae bacterium]MDA8975501.1 TIGR03943 family protein [Akkermansiaceae bacterium]
MSALHTRLFGLLGSIWGLVLLYFYHSMRLKDYLAPDFHILVLIGGIGIIILGVFSIINPSSEEACGHNHSHDHDHHEHDHEHHDDCADCSHEHEGHGPGITYALTLLPLMGALYFTQDRLSAIGIAKKGLYETPTLSAPKNAPPFTREDLEKRVPKNADGEFQLSLVTAYYVAGDREVESIFDGLPVEFEGRIVEEEVNNESGLRRRIYRSIISCCAADMSVVGIPLEFEAPSNDPPNDSWVKASGTLTFEDVNGDRVPLLKVKKVATAEEPYSEFLLRQ